MKKLLFAFLTFFVFNIKAQNDVNLTAFPKDMQLLPRNVSTNKSKYTITGSVTLGSGISSLFLKITKSQSTIKTVIKETSYPLSFNQNTAAFSIPFEINAELANYTIELLGLKNNDSIRIRKVENVVAGDVIVINGQSNNIGPVTAVDDDPFLRSYTDNFGWNVISYTQPGLWAPRIAKNIIQNHKIPVAIFNESQGGERISYFLKNDGAPYSGNYGTLYKRLENAEVRNNIRAFIWWQGESDGWETSIQDYKNQFKKLHSDWSVDYSNAHFYQFQIRFKACTHVKPYVFEAQRQLSNEIKGLGIMGTNAAKNDGCHFYYTGGYDTLGNRMYRLMAADLYNMASVNLKSPDIESAWFSGTNEITIQMKNVVGNLQQIGDPWADFRLETQDEFLADNSTNRNILGEIIGNQIILRFSGDSAHIKGVTYLGHITQNNDWIVNLKNIPILSFYNVPITAKPTLISSDTEGVASFEIYPTICDKDITIKWDMSNAAKKKISIYNIAGVQVLKKDIDKDEKIIQVDINNLILGYYCIVLSEEGKKDRVRRFVKIN